MTLFEPDTLRDGRPSMGLLFFLGPALAFVGAIYLLGLLGDENSREFAASESPSL